MNIKGQQVGPDPILRHAGTGHRWLALRGPHSGLRIAVLGCNETGALEQYRGRAAHWLLPPGGEGKRTNRASAACRSAVDQRQPRPGCASAPSHRPCASWRGSRTRPSSEAGAQRSRGAGCRRRKASVARSSSRWRWTIRHHSHTLSQNGSPSRAKQTLCRLSGTNSMSRCEEYCYYWAGRRFVARLVRGSWQ